MRFGYFFTCKIPAVERINRRMQTVSPAPAFVTARAGGRVVACKVVRSGPGKVSGELCYEVRVLRVTGWTGWSGGARPVIGLGAPQTIKASAAIGSFSTESAALAAR